MGFELVHRLVQQTNCSLFAPAGTILQLEPPHMHFSHDHALVQNRGSRLTRLANSTLYACYGDHQSCVYLVCVPSARGSCKRYSLSKAACEGGREGGGRGLGGQGSTRKGLCR